MSRSLQGGSPHLMLDTERLLKAGYLALCHGDTKTSLTEKGSRPRRKRLVESTYYMWPRPAWCTIWYITYLIYSTYFMLHLTQGAQDAEIQGASRHRETHRHRLASWHKTTVEKVSFKNHIFPRKDFEQKQNCAILQAFLGWEQLQRGKCKLCEFKWRGSWNQGIDCFEHQRWILIDEFPLETNAKCTTSFLPIHCKYMWPLKKMKKKHFKDLIFEQWVGCEGKSFVVVVYN